MNWAWWDGKMSFEHYREEHGLDSATLLDAAMSQPIDGEGCDEASQGALPAAEEADKENPEAVPSGK